MSFKRCNVPEVDVLFHAIMSVLSVDAAGFLCGADSYSERFVTKLPRTAKQAPQKRQCVHEAAVQRPTILSKIKAWFSYSGFCRVISYRRGLWSKFDLTDR